MRKIFKRTLSIILSVLMIATMLPTFAINAFAASGTLSKNGTGVPISGSESRWSNNQMNIVNDREANNTDAGIIRYDISSLIGKSVTSATLNYKIDSWSADTETTGLVFYYSTSINNESTYINNGETKSTGWSCGSDTTANNSFATGLGFSTSNVLVNVSKGSATSNSTATITTALKNAVEAGATKFFIIIMQQKAGGKGSNSGWSDTKVTPANFTISYTAEDKTRADVANIKKNLTSKTLSNYPYSGTMNRAEDGSYTKDGLTGGDQMLNVLYTMGCGSSGKYSSQNPDFIKFGLQYGNVTLLWDGENDMAFPLHFWATRTKNIWGSNYNMKPHSLYLDNSYLELRHIWHGCVTSNDAQYVTATDYGINTVNSHTVSNPKAHDLSGVDKYDRYSNTVYINKDKLSFEDNGRQTIQEVKWHLYYADNNKSDTAGFDKVVTCNNSEQVIRIINYAPIANAIREGKKIYNTVSANEMDYCAKDLYKFYYALDKLTSFNPNDYFAYNSNGYEACCKAMEALDGFITLAQTTPAKSNWSYNYNSAAQNHTMTCSVCGETVTEDCSWNTGVTTKEATCFEDGVKTYTCTKCKGTKTEVIPATGEHNFTESIMQGDVNQHYAVCSVCKKWNTELGVKLAHDSNATLEAKTATCTETGLTEGKACSVCGKVMEAQQTISVKEHTVSVDQDADNKDLYIWTQSCETNSDHNIELKRVDAETYRSAVQTAQAEMTKTNVYTPESIATLKGLLAVEPDFSVNSAITQTSLDETTRAIQSALVFKEFTVSFYYQYDNEEAVNEKTFENKHYSDAIELALPADVKGDVVKWVVSYIDSDKDVVLSKTDKNTTGYAVENMVYTVILAKEKTVAPTEEARKVTLLNSSKKVADIQYTSVAIDSEQTATFSYTLDNGSADIVINSNGNTTNMVAAKPVFYNVVGFTVDGVKVDSGDEISLAKDVTIRPLYEADLKIEITRADANIKINGNAADYTTAAWDEKITVTAEDATDDTVWYIDGTVAGYGKSYSFYVTKSCVVSYTNEAVEKTATASVDYFIYDVHTTQAVTVTGSYSLPKGFKFVEAGMLLKTDRTTALDGRYDGAAYTGETTLDDSEWYKEAILSPAGKGGHYVATKFTSSNQFAFSVSRTATTSFIMGAVAYVTYEDEDGVQHTTYSPMSMIAYQQ